MASNGSERQQNTNKQSEARPKDMYVARHKTPNDFNNNPHGAPNIPVHLGAPYRYTPPHLVAYQSDEERSKAGTPPPIPFHTHPTTPPRDCIKPISSQRPDNIMKNDERGNAKTYRPTQLATNNHHESNRPSPTNLNTRHQNPKDNMAESTKACVDYQQKTQDPLMSIHQVNYNTQYLDSPMKLKQQIRMKQEKPHVTKAKLSLEEADNVSPDFNTHMDAKRNKSNHSKDAYQKNYQMNNESQLSQTKGANYQADNSKNPPILKTDIVTASGYTKAPVNATLSNDTQMSHTSYLIPQLSPPMKPLPQSSPPKVTSAIRRTQRTPEVNRSWRLIAASINTSPEMLKLRGKSHYNPVYTEHQGHVRSDSQLRKRSKAHNGGLQEGDILVSINGKNVEGKSHPDAMSLVDAAGNDIDMVVMRGSETARQFGIGVEQPAPVKQAAAPAPVEQPKPLKVAKIPAVKPTEPVQPAQNVAPSKAQLNFQQPYDNIEKHNVTEETFKQGDSTHNIRTEVQEGTVGNAKITKTSRQEKITTSSGDLGHSGGKQIFKVKNIAERLGGKIDQTQKIPPSSFEPGRQFGEIKKTTQTYQAAHKPSQPEINPMANPGIQYGEIKKTPKAMPGPGPKFQVRNVQANVLQPSQITLGLSNSQPKPEEPSAPQPKIWSPGQPSTKENVSPAQVSPVSKGPQFNVRRISGPVEKPPTWQPTHVPQPKPQPPKEDVKVIPIQHDPPSQEVPMEQDDPSLIPHQKGHFWASPNKQVSVLKDEAMDTSPDSSITSGRRSKKKMFADSAFYDNPDAQYPSIDEQIEMCRRVAAQLTSPANQKARGAKMFMKRVKKAGKWTHAGSEFGGSSGSGHGDIGDLEDVSEPYEPPSPDPNSALFSFKIPQFSPADLIGGKEKLKTKLTAQDLENMRLSKPKNVHNTVPAEACFSLASALQEAKGRGGKIFEKRRAKSENWVVDESNVKEPPTPPPAPPKSAGPEVGGQQPRNRLTEMVELAKAEVTPWEAAAENPYGNLDKAFSHLDKYKRDIAAAEIKADLKGKGSGAPTSSTAPSTAMWTPASQSGQTVTTQSAPHKTPPPTMPKTGGKANYNKKPMGWSPVGQPSSGVSTPSSQTPRSQSTGRLHVLRSSSGSRLESDNDSTSSASTVKSARLSAGQRHTTTLQFNPSRQYSSTSNSNDNSIGNDLTHAASLTPTDGQMGFVIGDKQNRKYMVNVNLTPIPNTTFDEQVMTQPFSQNRQSFNHSRTGSFQNYQATPPSSTPMPVSTSSAPGGM
ncbi:unnamed protein product, partial [Owenia fusiformis]